MPNITAFDPKAHHIRFVGSMTTADGVEYEFRAILDTGAPWTEFSDQFLHAVGMLPGIDPNVNTRSGLQTQKYGRLTVPRVKVCDHDIHELSVSVSHFEKNWGVDALIGLDFFKMFRVTIDYKEGQIITESY
jgi:hypothetical protein